MFSLITYWGIYYYYFTTLKQENIYKTTLGFKHKATMRAGPQWLITVILATPEAEIRRITVQSQPRQIVPKILSRKYSIQNSAGGVGFK
jgi:hypothetical protein